jgi:hypothetical protein
MARWTARHSAAVGLGTFVGIGAVLRWRRRHTGDAMALDLSPLVTRSADLVDGPSEGARNWPRGVQEDDDVRWRWERPAPESTATATTHA